MTLVVARQPAHGSVALGKPRSFQKSGEAETSTVYPFTYTPKADYVGEDAFAVTLSDGTATTEPLTIPVAIAKGVPPDATSAPASQPAAILKPGLKLILLGDFLPGEHGYPAYVADYFSLRRSSSRGLSPADRVCTPTGSRVTMRPAWTVGEHVGEHDDAA